jgi:hypothetical protein
MNVLLFALAFVTGYNALTLMHIHTHIQYMEELLERNKTYEIHWRGDKK